MLKRCPTCNSEFSGRKERKYCSHPCYALKMVGVTRVIAQQTRQRMSIYAKKRPPQHRARLGVSHKRDRAWNWKGDEVSYKGLHKWVREQRPSNGRCEKCGLAGHIDLANISGGYLRDLADWIYLCRRCHMESDGRLEALIYRNANNNPSKLRVSKETVCNPES